MNTRQALFMGLGALLLFYAIWKLTHVNEQQQPASPFSVWWDRVTKGDEPIPVTQLFGNWFDIFPLDRVPYPSEKHDEGEAGGGFAGGGGGGW